MGHTEYNQVVKPSNPVANKNRQYYKASDKPYYLTSAGIENSLYNGESLSTGLLSGGILSINANDTLYDITAGTGQVVDINGNKTEISWNTQTGLSFAYTGI